MTQGPDTRKARKKPRKRRRRPSPEERVERIFEELRQLTHSLAEREGAERGAPLPIEELVLPLSLRLNPKDGQAAEDAARLVDDLRSKLHDRLSAQLSFRLGRVYCFQCKSASCTHTAPADLTDTFAGYSATGKPSWVSFPNLCIQRSDPRVDQIYAEQPTAIAIAQTAEELTGELLPGFGHKSVVYNVLGQVAVGLIPARWWPHRREDARVAVTLQFVEVHAERNRKRLRLNIFGVSPDDIAEAGDLGARAPTERFRRLVNQTDKQLSALSRRAILSERRGKTVDPEWEVASWLGPLASDLEKVFGRHAKRTQHAQDRHVSGNRPTSSALRDAREAPDERLLYDEDRSTVVVLGPKGRAHLFSLEGKHVTSLQLRPGELERKTRKRWGPISGEMIRQWRSSVGASGSER